MEEGKRDKRERENWGLEEGLCLKRSTFKRRGIEGPRDRGISRGRVVGGHQGKSSPT